MGEYFFHRLPTVPRIFGGWCVAFLAALFAVYVAIVPDEPQAAEKAVVAQEKPGQSPSKDWIYTFTADKLEVRNAATGHN